MSSDIDPVVEGVHQVRRDIAIAFDHDVRKFLAELRRLDHEQFGARLVEHASHPEPQQSEPLAPKASR